LGTVNKHATIAASVEDVFEFTSNPRNAPSYINSIRRIIAGPDGAPQQGQVYRAAANFLGKATTIDLRVAELRPPYLVRFSIEGEPAATLSLRITPPESSTRVALTLEVPSVPGFLLEGLMGGLLGGDMARLKRALEQH
jgi:hypothetical protein